MPRRNAPRVREKLREQLKAGELEDRQIEIQIEQRSGIGVLGPAGMEMDVEFQSMLEKMMPTRRESRRLSVRECARCSFPRRQKNWSIGKRFTRRP